VHLDMRHFGARKLRERLPQICELAEHFLGIDPAKQPIPVCPGVHYTMGGILVNMETAAPLPGLFAGGECASAGIHGANRLGSNSLSELGVFGKMTGIKAAAFARSVAAAPINSVAAPGAGRRTPDAVVDCGRRRCRAAGGLAR
jgi:fumarate reductase flavoprotein subunit